MKNSVSVITLLSVFFFGFAIGENGDNDDFEIGYFNEIIESAIDELEFSDEEVLQMRQEATRILGEAESDPDTRFSRNLEAVAELTPGLSGISSTWKLTNKIELFSVLTTGLGEYYGNDSSDTDLLRESISQLNSIVPKENHDFLESQMDRLSRWLAHHVRFMRDNFHSKLTERKANWESTKEHLLDQYPSFDGGSIDEYMSCLETLKTTNNDHTARVFTSLNESLISATDTIKKMVSTEIDFSSEIADSIFSAFTPHKKQLDEIEIKFIKLSVCDDEATYLSIENQVKENFENKN